MRKFALALIVLLLSVGFASAQVPLTGAGQTGGSAVGCVTIGPLTQVMDPNQAAAINSGSPTLLTSGCVIPAGSLVFIQAYPNAANATISAVTDQGTGGSNTYAVVTPAATAGLQTIGIGYVSPTTHAIPAGSTWTVTTSTGVAYNMRGVWYAPNFGGGIDVSSTVAQLTAGTAVAGLTVTPTNVADLVIGSVQAFSATSGSTVTPSSPWTLLYNLGHTHLDYALPASTSALAYAPTWTTSSNYSAIEIAFKPTYTGPGDVTTGWLAWYGLRAFSTATRGNALINACYSPSGADSGCADMSSDPVTGKLVPATIAANPCPGTNCTVKSWYNQTGSTNTATQATVSARASLDASCIGTLPCATGVDIVNGIYTATTALTASVPWSMTSVIFWVGSANATAQAATMQAQAVNERLQFIASTNTAGFSCGSGTTATQAITANNWFAMTGVCNGTSGIFAVNATTNTSQNAGSDALVTAGNTYSVMRKTTGRFVEGGTNSNGFSTGTITNLHANERNYWGF